MYKFILYIYGPCIYLFASVFVYLRVLFLSSFPFSLPFSFLTTSRAKSHDAIIGKKKKKIKKKITERNFFFLFFHISYVTCPPVCCLANDVLLIDYMLWCLFTRIYIVCACIFASFALPYWYGVLVALELAWISTVCPCCLSSSRICTSLILFFFLFLSHVHSKDFLVRWCTGGENGGEEWEAFIEEVSNDVDAQREQRAERPHAEVRKSRLRKTEKTECVIRQSGASRMKKKRRCAESSRLIMCKTYEERERKTKEDGEDKKKAIGRENGKKI